VWEDQAPSADAGDDVSVHCESNGFALVQLDGSGSSDADGDPLDYYWSWTIDQQEYAAEGVAPVIQLPLGKHTITLIVSDGIVDSDPTAMTVTVYNTVPMANAGTDCKVYLGFESPLAQVTLDGSGSGDADGHELAYKWYLGDTLLSEEASPTISLAAGDYTITLIVNDGIEDSTADEVAVKVVKPVRAAVMVLPGALNLKNHERYVWMIMDLPRGISLSQLDKQFGYFVLPGQVEPAWVGYLGGWNPTVMARVEFKQLESYLHAGRMNVTFYGRLNGGRYIGGSANVFVLDPPDKKHGKK
jgi:hypothetical protein